MVIWSGATAVELALSTMEREREHAFNLAKIAVASDERGDYTDALPAYEVAIAHMMACRNGGSADFALEQRIRGYLDRAEAIKVHLRAERSARTPSRAARPAPAAEHYAHHNVTERPISAQRHGRQSLHSLPASQGGFAPRPSAPPLPPSRKAVARAAARAAASAASRAAAREHAPPSPSRGGSSARRPSTPQREDRIVRQARIVSETWVRPAYAWAKRIALREAPGGAKTGATVGHERGPWRATHEAWVAGDGTRRGGGEARWMKLVGIEDMGRRCEGWVRERSPKRGHVLFLNVGDDVPRLGGGGGGGVGGGGAAPHLASPGARRRGGSPPRSGRGEKRRPRTDGRRSIGEAAGDSDSEEEGGGGMDLDRELAKLIGLDPIKQQLRDLRDSILLDRQRSELYGIDVGPTHAPHMLFMGNPGVGKTMVARLLGRLLASIGVVRSGHLVEATREDLVGQHIGSTAIKTAKVIDAARGGVLFVDEAYQLTPGLRGGGGGSGGSGKDFGLEALETMMNVLNDHDPVFVFAGYPAEMRAFEGANAGLMRRIGSRFEFPDYSPLEIASVFVRFKAPPFELEPRLGVESIAEMIAALTTSGQRAKYNAGLAERLFVDGKNALTRRVAAGDDRSRAALMTFICDDLVEALRRIPPA